MENNKWKKIEPGWWCKADHGCIVKERGGWFFHATNVDIINGPYKTMGKAIKENDGE